MLVESNSDDAVVDRIDDWVIWGAPMDKHSRFWKGTDILVVNSYHRWMTGEKIQTKLQPPPPPSIVDCNFDLNNLDFD
jgi:hypothetical protein